MGLSSLGRFTSNISKGMDLMEQVVGGPDPLRNRFSEKTVIEASRNGTLTLEQYEQWLHDLNETLFKLGNPWEFGLNAIDPTTFNQFNPYSNLVERIRGGILTSFTSRYVWEDTCFELFQKHPTKWTNPFRKVLILTDGMCGSSCDTSTRTAHMLAKLNPEAITVKYITYGGLGGDAATAKNTLSATSFQGGNVENTALQTVWGPLMHTTLNGLLVMEWSGFPNLTMAIRHFFLGLPELPYWGSEQLPGFSQSQIYQRALGDDSLPMEYYFEPTDIYLPDWYSNVGGQSFLNWDEMELLRVHTDAAKAFAIMPNPHDGPNLLIRILKFLLPILLVIFLIVIGIYIHKRRQRVYICFGLIRIRDFKTNGEEQEEEESGSVNDVENCSSESHQYSA